VLGLLSLLPRAYVTRSGYGAHLEQPRGLLRDGGDLLPPYRSTVAVRMIAMGLGAAATLFELSQYEPRPDARTEHLGGEHDPWPA
jgi:hypothetical protein